MALSDKQTIFVEEYLKTYNATKAAIAAGYSSKTAYSIGWENLRKPEISKAISQRLSEISMSADEVLMRLAQEARGDISDFWDIPEKGQPSLNLAGEKAKGKLHLIRRMKVKTTDRMIGEIEVKTTEVDFELYDAQAAKALLGKHHDLFIDKLQVKIEQELEKTLDDLEKKLDADTYRRVLDAISGPETPT